MTPGGRCLAFFQYSVCSIEPRDRRQYFIDEAAVCGQAQQDLAVSGAVVDITDDPAVEAWTNTCADCMGGIDILVANAGAVANKPVPYETRLSSFGSQPDQELNETRRRISSQ